MPKLVLELSYGFMEFILDVILEVLCIRFAFLIRAEFEN